MSSKSLKRRRIIAFIFVNAIQYPRTLKNNIYHLHKWELPLFLHLDTFICNWPRSGPFCWQDPCFGCNRGFDLVVVLENNFFQLCYYNPRKFLRFTRFIRSYVNHPAVVLINHCQSYTACLMCAVQSCHVPFFCSCLFPMIMHLHCWAHLLLECCEL